MTTLTMKKEKRLEILQTVFRGELSVVEAALILGISQRHCYRAKRRITKQGAKGVMHGTGAGLRSRKRQ
jgi:DNA-directed RNA polymerase specialized sigma subunit